MHMQSRSAQGLWRGIYISFHNWCRETHERSEKNFIYWKHIALMSAPAKPKKHRRKLCELFLIICWVITLAHTSISPPLVSRRYCWAHKGSQITRHCPTTITWLTVAGTRASARRLDEGSRERTKHTDHFKALETFSGIHEFPERAKTTGV